MSSTPPINIGFPKAPLRTTGAPSTSRCIDGCQNPDGPGDRVRFGAKTADESGQDDLTVQQQKPFNLKKTLQKWTSSLFVQSLINSVMPFLAQVIPHKYLDYVTPTTQDAIQTQLSKLYAQLKPEAEQSNPKRKEVSGFYEENVKPLLQKDNLSDEDNAVFQQYWDLVKEYASPKIEKAEMSYILLDRLKTLHQVETLFITEKGKTQEFNLNIDDLKASVETYCQKLDFHQNILSCTTLDEVKTSLSKITTL